MIRIFEHLRSLLIWIFGLPVFAVSCLAVWLASFFRRGPGFERLIKSACRFVLFMCGIRLRVEGRENCVPGRPYIVMMNHVNFFDPFVLYAGFPGWARGVEEESHFRWPIYGPTIRRIGAIPISRTSTPRAMASLAKAAELIRREKDFSFVVLPEGTRTRDGKLGKFKRGGFLLALETGLDILPIIQIGASRINRRGSRLIRPGKVRFVIAPAVPTAGTTKETQAALIERVRAVFLRELGEDKQQPSGLGDSQ
jgi:1-acyl-sn-glycerol-3-phosphate acyltransferase